jgi:hypothetical protein
MDSALRAQAMFSAEGYTSHCAMASGGLRENREIP